LLEITVSRVTENNIKFLRGISQIIITQFVGKHSQVAKTIVDLNKVK